MISPSAFGGTKVERATVRDQTIEKLRSAITSGNLQPGQRLVEKHLCDLLGVSRTSVREALRMLEGEKLISSAPHRGPCVAIPSPQEARQIYEVRSLLEHLLGSQAAQNITPAQVLRLNATVDDFARAVEAQDRAGLVRSAGEFYDVMLEASMNDVVADILKTLHARIALLRGTSMSTSGRAPNSLREMRAIAKAIARRDAEAAAKACARHVELAATAALKALDQKSLDEETTKVVKIR